MELTQEDAAIFRQCLAALPVGHELLCQDAGQCVIGLVVRDQRDYYVLGPELLDQEPDFSLLVALQKLRLPDEEEDQDFTGAFLRVNKLILLFCSPDARIFRWATIDEALRQLDALIVAYNARTS